MEKTLDTITPPAASELAQKGQEARAAARTLAFLNTESKNRALEALARALIDQKAEIIAANQIDLSGGHAAGLGEALLARLVLDDKSLTAMAADVRTVAQLSDPVGETIDMRILPNGLQVGKRRIPLGVLGVIYESRPNVTVDIACLALKSGNAVVMRGGKEAVHSNRALARIVQECFYTNGIPPGAVALMQDQDRAAVLEMLRARAYFDLIIPRGGATLHRFAIENATVPVVTGGIGVVHIYVDASANIAKAIPLIENSKIQKPSACNALDTLLVHRSIVPQLLPLLGATLKKSGVRLHVDDTAMDTLAGYPDLEPAQPADFGHEWLSMDLSVKIVDDFDAALDHIYSYGSGHSEAILTENYSNAQRFLQEVDAAAVFVNASTRFNDGAQFGLGAEVAISTQRLHARGPMGLKELTTYKWIVLGEGHVRP
ncbi:MAG: glutamate-5-semialdehyde dehydrogenase [Chloroflexi bacterium]|nr:glutamate-5-semialdehyde dehydrogenase [Chloroflexota bacterium]